MGFLGHPSAAFLAAEPSGKDRHLDAAFSREEAGGDNRSPTTPEGNQMNYPAIQAQQAWMAMSIARQIAEELRTTGQFDKLAAAMALDDAQRLFAGWAMARVRNITSEELSPDLAAIYERFAGLYGPFRNQVAVFAHVPPALRHLLSLLIELREAATLPKRALELAIVTVSKLNACHYCVAHHTPFLVVEGVSPAGIDRILDYRNHPEFDDRDKLVVEYAIAAWDQPNRIGDGLFARLRRYFSEAQIVELTLRITLCGFFNKFNDALGIEEETEAVAALTACADA